MTFPEIAKKYGIRAVAKMISDDNDAHSIDEREFLAAGNAEFGKAKFTEKLTANDAEGILLRKTLRRLQESA